MDNTCTRKELNTLLEYVKSKEGEAAWKDQIDTLWESEQDQAPDVTYSADHKDQVFSKLMKEARTAEQEFRIHRAPEKSFKWYKVAAVFILLAASTFMVYKYQFSSSALPKMVYLEKINLPGQKSTITLSDGSTVRLNSGSKLTYPAQFGEDVRDIKLEGEAFFEVAKNPDKPFKITSGELTTTVLGTSFNIRAYPDQKEIQVAVATGRVQVQAERSETNDSAPDGSDSDQTTQIYLTPNQVASYDMSSKNLSKATIEIEELIAWKDGWLIFNNQPLEEVAETLERWYGMNITIEDNELKGKRVTLKQQGESLLTVLKILSYAGNFKYKFENGTVVISQ